MKDLLVNKYAQGFFQKRAVRKDGELVITIEEFLDIYKECVDNNWIDF